MTAVAHKRRKTEHVSSEDDDDVSFASFGEEGVEEETSGDSSEDEEMVDAVDGAPKEDDDGDASEGSDDDDGDDDEGERKPTITASKAPPVARDNRRKMDGISQLGASALANGTFKSNVFKLQVDELLGQVRPRQGQREAAAEAALHKLKKTVEHIPARGPFLVGDAESDLLKEKVAIPFPEPRPAKDAKFKFAYAKPANVNVVGSFALKTSLRSRDQVDVDMVVVMPSEIFDDKDYLNYRYFYKRAYYLACIAAGLKNSHKADFKIQFKLLNGDPLKPILVVGPTAEPGNATTDLPASRWRINIIPCAVNGQFSSDKLRPDRNCVRGVKDEKPTPFYNSSLRSDMLTIEYLKLLHSASKRCEAFKDACLLGSTWLRQRGFSASLDAGGFGNFEWNTLVALSLQGGGPNGKPLLGEGYSSYQLFKATLQVLAVKDLNKQPLVVRQVPDVPKVDGVPLMWDAERSHSLFYKVQPWSYKALRSEARSTLNALGDSLHDGFDATFILRVHELLYRNDYIVQVPESLLRRSQTKADLNSRQHLQKLYDVLKEGLGDRVSQISVTSTSPEPWDLGSSQSKAAPKSHVTIGLTVNPDNVKRTVDHGPSAEQKAQSAAFRKFWGEKAELRRFKDGSILESLVWATPQESGQSVLEQVLRYILGHHFGAVTTDDLKLFGDDFTKMVKGGTDIKPFEPLMARYKQFENDVRGLHDLPLSIRQIMPAHPQLCYSSIRPPPNGKGRPMPADVTIQFEGSGRWPDDLVAIQQTKIAFLLKIAQLLEEAVDSVTTRIGLENESQDVLNQGFLDVTYDMDATFRLRIYHDREVNLLERQLKDKATDPRTREVAAIGLAKYKCDYLKSPSQTQALTRLCTRFPALSGSIRLTKTWFASHLLTNHIPDEVIELLVVQTFTQPSPWQTPSSIQTGFLRTIFRLSRWDWRVDPLIVDLSVGGGELKAADMKAITTNFEAWRKLDPGMNRVALFAASNLDHEGTTWTDGRPAKVVAGRMTALAKAACAEIADKQLQLEPPNLFSSPLSDFDFILHLNPAFSDGRSKKSTKSNSAGSGPSFKNLEFDSLTDPSQIGFDPLRGFLHDLERVYGAAILFFYGGGGGSAGRNVIAGLWSPATARRGWRVNLAFSTIPVAGEEDGDGKGDVQADVNRMGILAEIARVGGDLIERVEVVGR